MSSSELSGRTGAVFSRFDVPSAWGRIGASLLDGLVFGVPGLLAAGIGLVMLHQADGSLYLRDSAGVLVRNPDYSADAHRMLMWFSVVGFPLGFLYQAGMVVWRGGTLGKRWCGMRIVSASSGEAVGWREATIRWFVNNAGISLLSNFITFSGGPSAVNYLLSFWWFVIGWSILANPLRRGWHDQAAGTIVVLDRARALHQPPPASARDVLVL